MSRDEQISEMSKDIEVIENGNGYVDFYKTAEILHRKGYRKIEEDPFRRCTCLALGCDIADDLKRGVAREIFEEIEKTMASVYNDFMFNREGVGMRAHYVVAFSDEIDLAIAELKKKYTEEGK